MESVPVKDTEALKQPRTVTEREMTVHNIDPSFPSKEARDSKKKEIIKTLYSVFSKYM